MILVVGRMMMAVGWTSLRQLLETNGQISMLGIWTLKKSKSSLETVRQHDDEAIRSLESKAVIVIVFL